MCNFDRLSLGATAPVTDSPFCPLRGHCPHTLVFLSPPHSAVCPGTPGNTWVKGYGIKAGANSVIIQAVPPFQASEYSDIAVTVNGQRVVLGPTTRRVLVSADKEVRVERWENREGVLLVTLHSCDARLLVFVRKGWTLLHPRLSLDVLDWDNLDSPHGIIGQTFPNRAKPRVFSEAAPNTDHQTASNAVSFSLSNTVSGTVSDTASNVGSPHSEWEAAGYTSRTLGSRFRSRFRARADARRGKRLTPTAALRRLYSMTPTTRILDGVPEDYQTSGILEADCTFSRLSREDQASPEEDPDLGLQAVR